MPEERVTDKVTNVRLLLSVFGEQEKARNTFRSKSRILRSAQNACPVLHQGSFAMIR
jgi:hypothetical protein